MHWQAGALPPSHLGSSLHLASQPPNPLINHHSSSTTSPVFTLGHHLDVQPLWDLLTFVIPAVTGSTVLSSSSPRPSPSLALAFKLLETYSNLSPAFSPSTFTSSWNYPTLGLLCSYTQAAVLCGGNDSVVQVGMATASLPPPSADPLWSLAILSHAFPQ